MSTQHSRPSAMRTAVAIVGGCAALAARPVGSFGALAVTGAVGIMGVLVPVRNHGEGARSVSRWVAAVSLGITAFAVARFMSPPAVGPVWLPALTTNVLAAVAEEGFFRRLVYAELSRWGPAVAVLGAAAVFAVVHVPAYGVGVVPIDLAAGILLGWQRWATGGWSAPAVTHVAANLFQMG